MKKEKTQDSEEHFHIQTGMIDSHFHSRMMLQKGLDPIILLGKACKLGLRGGLDIGTEAGDTQGRAKIIDGLSCFGLAAGLYPSEAEHERLGERLDLLVKDIEGFPVIAIGEIGIDLHWNYATPKRQRDLMIPQIEIANRYGLPVIVHNREADSEVVEVLRSHPPAAGGIMHCYSSDSERVWDFLDAGMYISFAGNLTYGKGGDIREAVRVVPTERILIETDSPYLSPQAVRGSRNHPGHIGYVYEEVALLRGCGLEELTAAVRKNFFTLFPALDRDKPEILPAG
jgi:TatD DNase family protein